jgi:CheY-like chemotaxis protein
MERTNNNGDASPAAPLGVVLVVDDEPGIRSLARRYLEEGGYQVIEAEDGDGALALMESGATIDVLIADLQMPGLRGDAMAGRMQAARPGLKVLYVTGHSAVLFDDRPKLWEDEAFLDKPFSSGGLLQALSLLRWGTLDGPRAAGPPSPGKGWRPLWPR